MTALVVLVVAGVAVATLCFLVADAPQDVVRWWDKRQRDKRHAKRAAHVRARALARKEGRKRA